jgi:hypothetical protein
MLVYNESTNDVLKNGICSLRVQYTWDQWDAIFDGILQSTMGI